MNQPLGGYVGVEKAAAIRGLEKKRETLFNASETERQRLASETAAYRLQTTSDKFASSSNAADVSLQQATVGLVSKEEFARRRMAIEGGEAPQPSGHEVLAKDEKKRKKKKGANAGALSFAFDEDEDVGVGGPASAGCSQKKKAKFVDSPSKLGGGDVGGCQADPNVHSSSTTDTIAGSSQSSGAQSDCQ